jgi:hypothetical protein
LEAALFDCTTELQDSMGDIPRIVEERVRWEAKIATLRALRDGWAYQAVDQVWHVLDKALAIMEGREP